MNTLQTLLQGRADTEAVAFARKLACLLAVGGAMLMTVSIVGLFLT